MVLISGFCLMGYGVLVIGVLVGVAFFTLLERKILGYIQLRKGPNKVGVTGLFQPFADAMKLFTKGGLAPVQSNLVVYYLCPIMMLSVMLVSWMVFPLLFGGWDFNFGLLFFLCCCSLGVYSLFGGGWASNSKYALLGALRGAAQTLSYEVSLSLILLSSLGLIMGFNLKSFMFYQGLIWFVFLVAPLCLIWFVSVLAESNRTPFDFAEGESELVSGFNVEYSGGLFALLFMSEYGSMMLVSYLIGVMYFGGVSVWVLFWGCLFMVFMVWVRGSYPRLRYDSLMYLAWKSYLPVSLNFICFIMGIMLFCVWVS